MNVADRKLQSLQRRFGELLIDAYDEVVAAILERIKAGSRPSRKTRFPEFAIRENGMPSLSDGGWWTGSGPLEYSALLDPPYGDDEARKLGKFPPDGFPAVAALIAFALENPQTAKAYGAEEGQHHELAKVSIELQLAGAADMHFLRFGEVPVTRTSQTVVLKPMLKGLFDETLKIAILAPIALTRFDFDRLRLGEAAYIMRMSPDLQRARWSMKAYGASGHDSVLAAATHAFVLTGWTLPNSNWFGLVRVLSDFHQESREHIDSLFAALRLETGIDTGYAQEIRLGRGWLHRHNCGLPEVHAVGARRYPESFDNFGWTREDLPLVTKSQMRGVRDLFQILGKSSNERLTLAVRRLNTAMMRNDLADAILDATIALEILLGDGDGQAISWKLRMRAGALAGISGDPSAVSAMSDAIKTVYETRSAIVHGGRRRRGKSTQRTASDLEAKELAINALRHILKTLTQYPEFLDPLRIDKDLLMAPAIAPFIS